jgi:hypothetical protein
VVDPEPATSLPLIAARVQEDKAHVFVVEGDVAHARSVRVLGEREGTVYVDPSLPPGAHVVTQGRALLSDGDQVKASEDVLPPRGPGQGTRGAGIGRAQ